MAVKDERWVVIEAESLSGVLPETKYSFIPRRWRRENQEPKSTVPMR